jgi:hypothetical protein
VPFTGSGTTGAFGAGPSLAASASS